MERELSLPQQSSFPWRLVSRLSVLGTTTKLIGRNKIGKQKFKVFDVERYPEVNLFCSSYDVFW